MKIYHIITSSNGFYSIKIMEMSYVSQKPKYYKLGTLKLQYLSKCCLYFIQNQYIPSPSKQLTPIAHANKQSLLKYINIPATNTTSEIELL